MATTHCRHCGHQMDAAAPNCGNCGQPAAGGSSLDRPLATQAGPLGSPTGPLAAGRGPLAALIKPLVVLAVVGAIGYFLLSPVREAVEGAMEAVESGELFDDGGTVDVPGTENPALQPAEGYAGVADIAAALRAGGVPCRDVTIDSSSGAVESGSCRVRGVHVQMIVYRTQGTLEFATTEIYGDDWPFTFVHDQNWFVSTQMPLAKRIHRILGGTLEIAPSS